MKSISPFATELLAFLFLTAGLQKLHADSTNAFTQENYVSDIPGLADHLDPNLANPWGIAFSQTSPFWIADNGTGLTTVYNGEGDPLPLVVTIPPASGGAPPSTPTGIVFNQGAGFETEPGNPSQFIFATQDGTISGWNSGASAILKVDQSASGANFTGLAIGTRSSGDFLYAANFNAGTVDPFDSNFSPTALPGQFTDPNLPSGYAPFNIQNLGGELYVTYALKSGDDEVPGPGNGFVDVFDLDGNLQRRLISQGVLNAPWGVTIADHDFGPFGDSLLVGNFGDGRINVFDPSTGLLLGTLQRNDGTPIEIEGLWALTFGNGGNGGETDDLYFTAGIEDETHGLFGEISATTVPEAASGTTFFLGIACIALLFSRAKQKELRKTSA